MDDEPTVYVTERSAAVGECWHLAAAPRSESGTAPGYEIPAALWEAYQAARTLLIEAEGAIDLYVEVLHDENDEWSGRSA